VAVALANAQAFGFDTVGCSSTGNLANAVASQAARLGLKTFILVPADLEPAKILNTQVYGATLVRVEGSYDHVNRLSSQIADRYNWGFVNVNLRPYYAEGSKTMGFEIAEQLGWRLPDNIVCPMAGGSLITKIRKAFNELIALGLVEDKQVRFFGAQATGCSPIAKAVKNGTDVIEPQRPNTIARSLAIGNPADGLYAARAILATGGWAEDVSDVEIVSAMQELAETEGIFTETAGGVTTAVTARMTGVRPSVPGSATLKPLSKNTTKAAQNLVRIWCWRENPMAVRVLLPNAFQKHTNNTREIASSAANLTELITEIESRFPALRKHLRGEDGQIRRFINFYVNEEDIRFLGNEKYSFQEGDEVLVIPSIAGG